MQARQRGEAAAGPAGAAMAGGGGDLCRRLQ